MREHRPKPTVSPMEGPLQYSACVVIPLIRSRTFTAQYKIFSVMGYEQFQSGTKNLI